MIILCMYAGFASICDRIGSLCFMGSFSFFLNTSLDDIMNFHDLCIIGYDTSIDGASLHIQCLERGKGVRNLR